MFNGLLNLNIVDWYVLAGFSILSLGCGLMLSLRSPKKARWFLLSVILFLSGAILALLAIFLLTQVFTVITIPLPKRAVLWTMGACGGITLASANFPRARVRRKILAGVSILVFALTAAIGVNASFGIDRTIGDVLGVPASNPIDLKRPPTQPNAPQTAKHPLWESWKPPADMPAKGQTGTQAIPPTKSGFVSRDAGIYLPPAALVPDAPALPLVILMMGQPGNPDPSYAAETLDAFAATHNGLAPIVIVADQLTSPDLDPVCTDSTKFGKVETFITQDVADWARANLNIQKDPNSWTIAGYSNGGACAATYAAKYPDRFGNLLFISGEEYPGSENPAGVLREVFKGDQSSYDAQKAINIFAQHPTPDAVGIFTVGSDDSGYVPQVKAVYQAAQAAGMRSTYYEVPNGGHVLGALMGGLQKGFEVLYPRLGLQAPLS